MKINYPKEWFEKSAEIESDCEIGVVGVQKQTIPVFMCVGCESIYMVKISQCDCHFENQEWIEGIAIFPIKNEP